MTTDQFISTAQLILLLLCIVSLILAVRRSIKNERLCRKRDSDFDRYTELLRSGKPDKAEALRRDYANDPVFSNYASAAKVINTSIASAKETANYEKEEVSVY